jgi:undecaprenyl-diphosphatase
MRSPTSELTIGQALALSALQGPTELLPISSSAHTIAAARLLGSSWDELDAELRKSFEVALHAGTALALITGRRISARLDRHTALLTAAACVPPAIAGYTFEREIEARLGTPATIAGALLAGSAAMILADRAPARRSWREAALLDGLWLGVAQAFALVPGVSRAGATLSTARLLGFRSPDANRLSEQVGLPVLAGACLLKAIRLWRRRPEARWVPVLLVGVGGSFVSTSACAGRVPRHESSARLLPYAVYRLALAGVILMRLNTTAHDQGQVASR